MLGRGGVGWGVGWGGGWGGGGLPDAVIIIIIIIFFSSQGNILNVQYQVFPLQEVTSNLFFWPFYLLDLQLKL